MKDMTLFKLIHQTYTHTFKRGTTLLAIGILAHAFGTSIHAAAPAPLPGGPIVPAIVPGAPPRTSQMAILLDYNAGLHSVPDVQHCWDVLWNNNGMGNFTSNQQTYIKLFVKENNNGVTRQALLDHIILQINNLGGAGDPTITQAHWELLKDLIAEDMFEDGDFNAIGAPIAGLQMRADALWDLFVEDDGSSAHQAKRHYLVYTLQNKDRLSNDENILAHALNQIANFKQQDVDNGDNANQPIIRAHYDKIARLILEEAFDSEHFLNDEFDSLFSLEEVWDFCTLDRQVAAGPGGGVLNYNYNVNEPLLEYIIGEIGTSLQDGEEDALSGEAAWDVLYQGTPTYTVEQVAMYKQFVKQDLVGSPILVVTEKTMDCRDDDQDRSAEKDQYLTKLLALIREGFFPESELDSFNDLEDIWDMCTMAPVPGGGNTDADLLNLLKLNIDDDECWRIYSNQKDYDDNNPTPQQQAYVKELLKNQSVGGVLNVAIQEITALRGNAANDARIKQYLMKIANDIKAVDPLFHEDDVSDFTDQDLWDIYTMGGGTDDTFMLHATMKTELEMRCNQGFAYSAFKKHQYGLLEQFINNKYTSFSLPKGPAAQAAGRDDITKWMDIFKHVIAENETAANSVEKWRHAAALITPTRVKEEKIPWTDLFNIANFGGTVGQQNFLQTYLLDNTKNEKIVNLVIGSLKTEGAENWKLGAWIFAQWKASSNVDNKGKIYKDLSLDNALDRWRNAASGSDEKACYQKYIEWRFDPDPGLLPYTNDAAWEKLMDDKKEKNTYLAFVFPSIFGIFILITLGMAWVKYVYPWFKFKLGFSFLSNESVKQPSKAPAELRPKGPPTRPASAFGGNQRQGVATGSRRPRRPRR